MKKSYIYADGQILAMVDHSPTQDYKYFYVHDRLGSVRLVIDSAGAVRNSYTYKPYGQFYDGEVVETIENPWAFTGQYFDREIGQYYLRARQYDPAMMRFTGRDPDSGEYKDPMTLHRYLYCFNAPTNYIDLTGEVAYNAMSALQDAATVYAFGLNVAAVGANEGDLTLIVIGGLIQEASSVAYIVGLSGVCFPAGTEVLTACGEIPIEKIQPGWYVWATVPETGELNLFKVVKCFTRETDSLVEITIDDEIIKTTPNHPFYVYDYGWCEAGNLTAGTKLVDVNGVAVEINRVESICAHTTVYNIEVENAHTYYVSDAKLLVHNMCAQKSFETVGQIMTKKLGSIKRVPLGGGYSWEKILNKTLPELEKEMPKRAYQTLNKLLRDGRFNK